MKTRALRWHVEAWVVIPPRSRYATAQRHRMVHETFALLDRGKADAFVSYLRKRFEDVRMERR